MDYKQREDVTEVLVYHAKLLQKLEALLEKTDGEFGRYHLIKLQADQVHWQTRFSRLVYLTGDIASQPEETTNDPK